MHKKNVDRTIWELIPQKNSIQKKALKKAVKKAGNANMLAQQLGVTRQIVSRWINKVCRNGRRIMSEASAKRIEKTTKIRGLAKELSKKYKGKKI